jgi:uncharacterized protein YrrD
LICKKCYQQKTAKKIKQIPKTVKQQKMKKLISNTSGEALEIANQVIYSLKVLIIGLFIPFSFIFGITYNRHIENHESEINISKPNPVLSDNTNVDLAKILSDKNS